MTTITATPQHRDLLAIGADVARDLLGVPSQSPHPLAQGLSLADVAYQIGCRVRPQQAHETDRAVMARGMSTSDFSTLLANAAKIVLKRTYETAADHLAFTRAVPVPDFRAVAVPGVDVAASLEEVPSETSEILTTAIMAPAGGAGTVSLRTFARVCTISRRAVVDGALAALESFAAGVGASAARLEQKLLVTALEANGNLDDGAALFHADHGNLTTSALDATALGAAMALMRLQRTAGGELAGVGASHLVVAPALEFAARKLLHESGWDEAIALHVLTELPAARWFLFANPAMQPVAGVLRLRDAKMPATVEPMKTSFEQDGVSVKARTDAAAMMLGRVGVVRGGA